MNYLVSAMSQGEVLKCGNNLTHVTMLEELKDRRFNVLLQKWLNWDLVG